MRAPPNKGMKLTKPGQLRSFAAYPQCWADVRKCRAIGLPTCVVETGRGAVLKQRSGRIHVSSSTAGEALLLSRSSAFAWNPSTDPTKLRIACYMTCCAATERRCIVDPFDDDGYQQLGVPRSRRCGRTPIGSYLAEMCRSTCRATDQSWGDREMYVARCRPEEQIAFVVPRVVTDRGATDAA